MSNPEKKNRYGERHRDQIKPEVGKAVHLIVVKMVSGCLALLYFLLGFHGGRQGCGPDRGQSPVEWGDFLFVQPASQPSLRLQAWLARPQAWLARPQAWLDGPEGGTYRETNR